MNDPTLSPDDPKLTAYALGELSGDERAHVEAVLRENPALRSTVEEIRAAAAQIEAALAAEASEDIEESESPQAVGHGVNGHAFAEREDHTADADVAGMLPGRHPGRFDGGDYRPRAGEGKLLRFPQLYVIIASAAAACFALFVYLRQEEYATNQQVADTHARIERRKREAERRAQTQPPPALIVTVAPTPVPTTDEVKPVTVPSTESGRTPGELVPSAPRIAEIPAVPPRGDPARTTPAPLVAVAESPTANSDPGLSLLEISRQDSMTAPIAGAAGTAVSLAPERAVAPGFGPVTRGTGNPSSLARSTTTPANAPKQEAPTTAQQPTTALAFAGNSRAKAFTAPASPSPADDIVQLDAFEVSAERLPSFIGANMLMNLVTVTRGMPEREPLPRPPLGGRFGSAREIAAYAGDNEFVRVVDNPTSRFAVDIDSASYGNVRRAVEQNKAPARDLVRVEELVNYFPYNYGAPKSDQVFAAALEVAAAPWAPERRLVRIGLKAREVATVQRGPANLVFLVDVSSSMGDSSKLLLVREGIRLLVNTLRPDDRVAIVTFAAKAVVALPSTPVSRASEIFAALNALKTAGASDGWSGLQLAYGVAGANFAARGANRVVLCTDGALDTGLAGERDILRLIEEKARAGIAFAAFGFGSTRENSTPLERLAYKAGALYGYVDSRREAERLMVERVGRSLAAVARDVKVQVDFNPTKVLAYRLIGYENRPLRREDYSDEASVVGEVGAGQTVTALYEIVPALPGDTVAAKKSEYVRYGSDHAVSSRLEMPDTRKPPGEELLAVKVNFKNPNTVIGWPRTQEFAVTDTGAQFAEASADFRFAAAVAEFGMILRGSPHRGKGTMRDVVAWADAARAKDDPLGYRRDFVRLARQAQGLYR